MLYHHLTKNVFTSCQLKFVRRRKMSSLKPRSHWLAEEVANAYLQSMGEHNHQLHKGEALAKEAQRVLTEAGQQWTDMRAEVYAALDGFGRPASAYDVADAVTKSRGKTVVANSIYRILDLFVASNLAIRIESANAFITNPHPDCAHNCVFLICDDCGCITHIDDDTLSDSVIKLAKTSGFNPRRPIIEVRGTCGSCH